MIKETKKIGLGLILSWFFGIIFGISGLTLLFTGVIVGGVALILSSLIVLPPICKFTKEKWSFELSRGLKITAVIILFIIYAVSLSNSEIETYTDTPLSDQVTQIETTEPQTYSFGDKVAIGNFAYTFNSY